MKFMFLLLSVLGYAVTSHAVISYGVINYGVTRGWERAV
ncbi:hypothetical protein CZ787_15200 [Halomonas citrativorans]|uniref:Uncharacterized protein n=1 Tax=Halomonas citrativorans TaxID=2742612 RepID=A0A1R4I3Y4_9GAMM|nr:hypothetical protein CZ787_15200 [Halomonas citrativorans]